MKSSKSKRKLTTEDICREYYESQIFRPTGYDEASPAKFFTDASIYLIEIDASFKGVDMATFLQEMIPVNIELFGLAWLNHNYELSEKIKIPDYVIPEEIVFTKKYLQENGRGDIWERMSFYNDEILKTVADGIIMPEGWGRFRDIPAAIREEDREEIAEEEIKSKIMSSTEAFSKYITDSECINRLAVRLLYIPCDINRLSQKFSLKLAEQWRCRIKPVGFFALQRVIVGLYQNAVSYLGAVRDYGSYEAYKETIRDLRQGLMRVASKLQKK